MDDGAAMNRRRVTRAALLSTVGIVLLVVMVFLLTNTVAVVSVTNKSDEKAVTVLAIVDGKEKRIGAGLTVLPRSTETVIVSAGSKASVAVPVDLPWLGIATITAQLQPNKTATKVAYEASGAACATYNEVTDTLHGYSCSDATQLLTFGDSAMQKSTKLSYIADQLLPPYLGGVIGIADAPAKPAPRGVDTQPVTIVATAPDGGKTTYAAPAGVSKEGLAGLRLFTDANDASNPRFVLVDMFGAVYLATPSEDRQTVSYERVDAPDAYNHQYNQTLCSIIGDSATCYRGRTSATPAEGATFDAPSISRLSFTEGQIATVKAPGIELLGGFYAVGDALYGKTGAALVAIVKRGDAYAAEPIIEGVGAVSADERLYFTHDNRVYVLDNATRSATQIYSTDRDIKNLYAVSGRLFVFSAAEKDSTITAEQVAE